MVLANPHFPWDGAERFYRMHLRIPGVYDVEGAALIGDPVVEIGHNECTKANGIEQGEFAEWVKSDFLAAEARS